MRIYAVADIHGKKHHLKAIYEVLDQYRPDLVVAAGDLTHFTNWRTCLSQLDSLPVPVLAIRGNTDFARIEAPLERANNLRLLTASPHHHEGISFVGTSGTLVLPFASRICLKENSRLSALPCPMDENTVLVVHPPPKGVRDRVAKRFSAGSRNLADFIKTARPGLVLCGHIHEQAGQGRIGKTVIVNCAMGKSSLGAVIDIEKGGRPTITFLHPDDIQE